MIALALLAVLCLAVAASAAGVPIEGKLLVEYWDNSDILHAYFMAGDSSTVVPLPWAVDLPELSPDTAKVAYSVLVPSTPYPEAADIWVANLDGSGAANLTDATGLGGVNCNPAWSPDGRMIAFQHSAPAVGQPRCGSGFQVWLMAADGTDLHQWIPSATFLTMSASWAPDGYRIACEGPSQSSLTGDVTGENVRTLPGVNGRDVEWSRNGAKIVYTTLEPETVAGSPGVWERLCVADPDGSNVQVLVEQFLKDSDLQAHIAKYNFQPPDTDWVGQIRWWVGPRKSKWSPLGNRIAFAAALPFDPNGPEFWYQIEVFVYDLGSGQVTRITNDENWDDWLSWAGPNTLSASPEVTVDNTTVAFSEVTEPGLTTIIREDSPPALPADYPAVGAFYQTHTTAQVTGPIAVSMTYADGDVAGAAENHLAIMHYNEATSQWEDVTTSRDIANNVIHGQTDSLSVMGLSLRLPTGHFSDVSSSVSDPFWALWEIEAAYSAGIVSGYEDGTYHPEYPVTRDQMAVYISRAVAGGDSSVPAFTATPTFPDVAAGNWALKYVEYAVDEGVVTGYEDGNYHPEYQVNRAQMAVYVARSLVAPSGEAGLADYVPSNPRNFPDVPSNYRAYKHIEYCVEHGVVNGYGDGLYHPEIIVTRDQMAVYVAEAFGL
jgi:Tol biopolymer transport system component